MSNDNDEINLDETDTPDAEISLEEPTETNVSQHDRDLADLKDLLLRDEKPVADEYNYNRVLAEGGKWFNWPTLGPAARLKLCKTKNRRYKELWESAGRKHGKRNGQIPQDVTKRLIPLIHAKTLFVDMEGISLKDAEGNTLDSVTREEKVGGKVVKTVYTFGLDGNGFLVNSEINRVTLFRLYDPDFGDDVFEACDSVNNFRDDNPEVRRGN